MVCFGLAKHAESFLRKPLRNFVKSSFTYVWQASKYVSAADRQGKNKVLHVYIFNSYSLQSNENDYI